MVRRRRGRDRARWKALPRGRRLFRARCVGVLGGAVRSNVLRATDWDSPLRGAGRAVLGRFARLVAVRAMVR